MSVTVLNVMDPAVAPLVLGADGPWLVVPGGLLVACALWPLLGPDLEEDHLSSAGSPRSELSLSLGPLPGRSTFTFLKIDRNG